MRSLGDRGLETASRLEAFITSDSVLDITDFKYHVFPRSITEGDGHLRLTTVTLFPKQVYLGANPGVA